MVRAQVVSSENHLLDDDDSWTIYHLRIVTAFKGKPPTPLELFTYRNSGGFYVDKGMKADIGGAYLLFLNPINSNESLPAAACGATQVNYECGQSRKWDMLTTADQRMLRRLSQRTR